VQANYAPLCRGSENILEACLQCLQLLHATDKRRPAITTNPHSALLPRFVGACAEVVNVCRSTTPPADTIYRIDI